MLLFACPSPKRELCWTQSRIWQSTWVVMSARVRMLVSLCVSKWAGIYIYISLSLSPPRTHTHTYIYIFIYLYIYIYIYIYIQLHNICIITLVARSSRKRAFLRLQIRGSCVCLSVFFARIPRFFGLGRGGVYERSYVHVHDTLAALTGVGIGVGWCVLTFRCICSSHACPMRLPRSTEPLDNRNLKSNSVVIIWQMILLWYISYYL